MALFVIAVPPAEFEAWRAAAARPAAARDQRRSAQRGEAAFRERGCGVCHAVRGTRDSGTRGPDLTHVGEPHLARRGHAAQRAPARSRPGSRASQHVKPDNLMPSFDMLPADELGAIAAYLEGLR